MFKEYAYITYACVQSNFCVINNSLTRVFYSRQAPSLWTALSTEKEILRTCNVWIITLDKMVKLTSNILYL